MTPTESREQTSCSQAGNADTAVTDHQCRSVKCVGSCPAHKLDEAKTTTTDSRQLQVQMPDPAHMWQVQVALKSSTQQLGVP